MHQFTFVIRLCYGLIFRFFMGKILPDEIYLSSPLIIIET